MSDAASGSGQRRHFMLLRLELAFVLVGAFLGAFNNDVSRIIAAISFVLAIVMRAGRIHTNPVADWHTGRAAAESLKTMCWRYAVCAAPFGREVSDDDADAEFVTRLNEVVEEFKNLRVPSSTGPDDGAQITAWMRATRALPLEERKEVYRSVPHPRPVPVVRRQGRRGRTDWRPLELRRAGPGVRRGRPGDAQPGRPRPRSHADPRHPARRRRRAHRCGRGVDPGPAVRQPRRRPTASPSWSSPRSATCMHAQREESDWGTFVDSAEGAISREHTMWKAARTGGAD